MKTKLILDITKSQQAQLNAVVTGRQGDKGTVTVNVFVVDGGVPYNLTGQDIYYEGLKPNNAYVRDKTGVKMINATQGNFEYTFRPETFGVAGIGKRSYFSIEQGGTIRASTQDFGLVTLADAMTGNTMSGPYISELEELINLAQWLVDDINSRWTSINDQLYQLQNKLDTMDVVRRSGDTMTGTMTFSNGNAQVIKYGPNRKSWVVHHPDSNSVMFVPETAPNSGLWDWAKGIEFKENGSIRSGVDTGWVDIILQPNVSNIDGRSTQAKRSGNTVTLVATYRASSLSGNLVMQLPSNLAPSRAVVDHVVDGAGNTTQIILNPDGNFYCSTLNQDMRYTVTYVI
ncbi:phage baseplate upper protein [Bacillus cereus]|uniref:phage baseplate upper protein n=1 Tax=Bacillus cereus TaxID=1396 RepID=UPI0021B4A1D6|nr:phage baseplate upper protein [Bacillus cereus]